jgi:hypothetical protein
MIGSRAEGEASNQSSSRKNAMCQGAYKTFSTEGTVFSFFDSRIRLRGVFLSIQHLGQKKTLWSPVFCLKKRENRTTGRKKSYRILLVGRCVFSVHIAPTTYLFFSSSHMFLKNMFFVVDCVVMIELLLTNRLHRQHIQLQCQLP